MNHVTTTHSEKLDYSKPKTSLLVPSSKSHWRTLPYDIHRIILTKLLSSTDVVRYIQSFIRSTSIGDLKTLLDLHIFLRFNANSYITHWPVLYIDNQMISTPGAIHFISSASHLYSEIVFTGDLIEVDTMNLAVTSSRPRIVCETYCHQFDEFDISLFFKFVADLPISKISKLDLTLCNIRDSGAYRLCSVLQKTQIQSLDLTRTAIGPLACVELAQILNTSHIKILCLFGNNIGNSGIIKLSKGLIGSKIEELNLAENNIGLEGCKALSEAMAGNQLLIRSLVIHSNAFGDAGFICLLSGISCSRIDTLSVGACEIGSEGCSLLSDILPKTILKNLNMRSNPIRNEGCAELSKQIWKSKLTHLCLDDCQINDEGLKHLFSKYYPGLLFLSVCSNGFGFDGIISIVSAIKKYEEISISIPCIDTGERRHENWVSFSKAIDASLSGVFIW
jgi:hypothetical protein